MEFEWHEAKNKSNIIKHGVDFEYAMAIFADEGRLCLRDDRKEYGEVRFITIGKIETYIYVVIHTARNGRIRIISARRANDGERKTYQDHLEPR